MSATGRTALYRAFAADGTLLYVGISNSVSRRVSQHEREKAWWGEVKSITLEHYPSRAGAVAAERGAILTEAPEHNIALTRPRRRRPTACVAEGEVILAIRVPAGLHAALKAEAAAHYRSLSAHARWIFEQHLKAETEAKVA